jgi:hypothetical protein
LQLPASKRTQYTSFGTLSCQPLIGGRSFILSPLPPVNSAHSGGLARCHTTVPGLVQDHVLPHLRSLALDPVRNVRDACHEVKHFTILQSIFNAYFSRPISTLPPLQAF